MLNKNKISKVVSISLALATVVSPVCSFAQGTNPVELINAEVKNVTVEDYSVRTYNTGTTVETKDMGQTVEVKVKFNNSVLVKEKAAEDFRVMIAGQDMFNEQVDDKGVVTPVRRVLSVKSNPDNDKEVIMTISIKDDFKGLNAQFNGKLVVKAKGGNLANIVDKQGNPVIWKDIDTVIPTGIKMSTKLVVKGTKESPASVRKKVDSASNVRAMVHINVTSNGQPIFPKTDIYKVGNIITHAHDFANLTTNDYAKQVVTSFNTAIAESEELKGKYIAEWKVDTDEFTIKSLNAIEGEVLDVNLYEWTEKTRPVEPQEPSKPTEPEKPTQPGQEIKFNDIADVSWAIESIESLAKQGIVAGKGDNKFAPKDTVTRAELVKVLASMSGEDLSKYNHSEFIDVGENQWFAKSVVWANANKIVFGSNGKFSPNDKITRQDMAVIIDRYNSVINKKDLPKSTEYAKFADEKAISSYAKDAVISLNQAEIIAGKGHNNFEPKGSATRAEMAKMIHGFLKVSGK